ncbi:MAG TPA: TlpA disulfide reductase family protein, partial [Terriglobia bacterium]|nr:TlpA disulfide reductase family protein [Terriglobia bacterium]
VIGVSVDQDEDQLKKFVADHGLTFPMARDPNQTLAGRYGTFKFPESYILDRDGRVAEKIVGEIDWQDPRILDFVAELAHPGERASR